MSVSSPVIQSIDGSLRRIYLNQGVSDYYPIEDIYHEYRYRRRTDEELRKYEPLLKAEGNVPKGGGAFTPRYVVLLQGTKIVPYDESLQLNQLGDMITDDPDTDPSLYDISGLTTAKPIFIKPSESEIIQLNSSNIEFSSFNGGVTIDVNNITGRAASGTSFPTGTEQQPVNNLADLHTILNARGFNKIYVKGDLDLEGNQSWVGHEFIGESALKTLIWVDSNVDVFNCEFYDCQIQGTLDGSSHIERSIVNDLDFIDGYIFNCAIGPTTITLNSGVVSNLFSCYSTVPGTLSPTIDMDGDGILALRDYNGGVKLVNYNGVNSHSIDLASGQVKLDPATITSGTFVVRGVGKLIDANTGEEILSGTWNSGVTIINELVRSSVINIIKDILEGDVIPEATRFRVLEKVSKAILVDKTATNVNGLTQLTEP